MDLAAAPRSSAAEAILPARILGSDRAVDAVDTEGLGVGARTVLAAAKAGGTAAVRLVLGYAVGPSPAAADPGRLDSHALYHTSGGYLSLNLILSLMHQQ